MEERILKNKKNGMAALLWTLLLYLAAAVGLIFGCVYVEDAASPWPLVLLIVSGVWLLVGWIPFLRAQGAQASGGPGADAVRQIRGHLEKRGLLLCQSLLHGGEPGGKDQAQPKRGRGRWSG